VFGTSDASPCALSALSLHDALPIWSVRLSVRSYVCATAQYDSSYESRQKAIWGPPSLPPGRPDDARPRWLMHVTRRRCPGTRPFLVVLPLRLHGLQEVVHVQRAAHEFLHGSSQHTTHAGCGIGRVCGDTGTVQGLVVLPCHVGSEAFQAHVGLRVDR